MSSRFNRPALRPVPVALCLFALTFAVMVLCAATAHAAYHKTLYCGAADGSGNPTLGARPASSTSPMTAALPTAIRRHRRLLAPGGDATGSAGLNDEASYSWCAPPGTSVAAISAYTREPGYFNDGWRARFWAEGFDGGSTHPHAGLRSPERRHLCLLQRQLQLPCLASARETQQVAGAKRQARSGSHPLTKRRCRGHTSKVEFRGDDASRHQKDSSCHHFATNY